MPVGPPQAAGRRERQESARRPRPMRSYAGSVNGGQGAGAMGGDE
jgi:hypothetical protein